METFSWFERIGSVRKMDRYRGKIENICENKRTFFIRKQYFL